MMSLPPKPFADPRWLLSLGLWCLCILGLGCRKQQLDVSQQQPATPSQMQDAGVVGSSHYPVRVQDDRGRDIVFHRPPQRIVVAGTALYSEILVDLGAHSRVIGMVDTPNAPAEMKTTPRVGRIWPLNVEKILSLQPDLVLGTFEPYRTQIEMASKIPVFTGGKKAAALQSLADIFMLIRHIDRIVHGHTQRSDILIQNMNTQMSALQRQIRGTPKKRVAIFYVPQPHSAQIYIMGKQSPGHELLVMAGGMNVFADYSGFSVNIEVLLQQNPELIITDPAHIERVKTHRILRTLAAVKAGRVYGIPATSFTSSRLLQVFQQLRRAMYGPPF